ncbi:MAG: hypothetical protein V4543_00670 [Bacteroidota bacterium]
MNLNSIKRFIPVGNPAVPVEGSPGSTDYVREYGIPAAVGGLPEGYIPGGSISDLLDALIYPYQYPAFTSFSVSGQASAIELGDSFTGNKIFLWVISNTDNLVPNSLQIRLDAGSNHVDRSAIANDGTETLFVSGLQLTAPGQHIFAIDGTNTKSETFTRQYTLSWNPRRMAGTIPAASLAALQAASTQSQINAVSGISLLTNDLVYFKPGGGNYNCSGAAGGKYIWFLWDATLGVATFSSGAQPAAFKALQIVSITNAFGVNRSYYLYISSNPFNGTAVPITVT